MSAQTNFKGPQVTNAVDGSPPPPAVHFRNLSRILRGLGAVVLVVSLSVFLLRGWEQGNDIQRYLLLLAHTVLLAATGLASGYWLKDGKGARTLLSLALVSVPVNFAILGAFLYSGVGWDGADMVFPSAVTWRTSELSTALFTSGGAFLLLAPLAWLGFLVMSRRSALRLTGLYLVANAALLIPVRDPGTVGWLLLALVVLLMSQIRSITRRDPSMKTPEGIISRAIQVLPLLLLSGRSLWLHSADAFLFMAVSAMVYLAVRYISAQMERKSSWRKALEVMSLAPASAFSLGLAGVVTETAAGSGPYAIPLFALAFAGLVVEISMRTAGDGAGYRRLAAVIAVAGLLGNQYLYGGVAAAFLCLSVGMAVLAYGYTVEQRSIFVMGLVSLLSGLANQIVYAFQVFNLGNWGSLALLGIAAIIAGSLVERYGTVMKARLGGWKRRFESWEY